MIIDSPIISGSYLSTGSLSQTGNVSITGSLTATGGISGSFSGSGADLFGIPASGITGLNLSQISSGSVSASISPSQGLLINTSVSASNFTGSFTGSLTGIATSASYASFALTSSYSLGGSGFPFSGSAVITGSLLVSGSAEITGSLSVSGSISASLFGTASQATSASYALTASYLLGYISPFPFTGSAAITGSLIVTGSVAISTLVTSSGVRYVIADQNGLLSAQTASAAIFTTQQVVSTAGQTTFPITNGYSTGYVTVFVNGTKLSADEYVDTSGTNIVFLTGSTAGDNVEFQKYLPAAGVSNNTLRSTNYFTATTGQTNFSVNYTPGLLDIFYNGAKLDNTEYTAANGTSITLATASAAGDRLEVDVYSYQVGAFSGIGGTGAANQLAYFNTSNSITGSNAFTVSGSAVIITGSLIVSGSGTLINIGPAVFSGSVTSTAGFSGSFSGNADSASLAQNSLLLQGTGSIGFATTASLLAVSSSQQQISASLLNVVANYATTGSNSFRADQSITGSLVVSSTITAQTLVVQTVTSSIVYSSGSNIFGNQLANTQTFTGSVNITGSSFNANVNTAYFNSSITASNALLRSADSAAVVDIFTLSNPSSTSSGVRQKYQNGYGDLAAIKVSQRDNSTLADDGQIEFQVASNSILDTKLTILNTGAATFSGTVNVYDASSRGLSISNSSGAITFSNNWGKTTFTSPSAQDIEFNDDAGVKRLFLKNGGNVGIGTTNPTGSLDVSGSIYIRSTGGGVLYIPRLADPSHGLSIGEQNTIGSKSAVIRTGGGVSEYLFIDPGLNDSNVAGNIALASATTGSVGIGTYLPGAKLEIVSPRNSTLLRLTATSGENWDFKNTNTVGSTDVLSIGVNGGTANLNLIDNGNVGIGTSTVYSGAKLHILGGLLAVEPTNGNTNSEILLGRGLSSLGTSAGSGITAKVNFAFEGSNDNFYQELGFITTTANQTRVNSAADFYISTKVATASSPTEKFRITSGGTVFNKQYVGTTLMGGYSLIGTIGPGGTGNRYLHARINTIGSMMVWIKIFGYSYAGGILEGIGGGYVDGGTGTIAQNFNNGSIPIIHQNAGYIEVVVDTVGTGTTNRWGSITFLGGTDTIATVQALEIMTYSWTSTTTRVY